MANREGNYVVVTRNRNRGTMIALGIYRSEREAIGKAYQFAADIVTKGSVYTTEERDLRELGGYVTPIHRAAPIIHIDEDGEEEMEFWGWQILTVRKETEETEAWVEEIHILKV